ncbi:Oidioi.mRNA.OKI2018_I69.PAR.g10684.t1.cds [Oikopleura dioica]|uniref:chitinase n=1 Tax=Oikopleura dioica TaxID=34765 RepID=A0ABN7RVZ2_OIKDI|nr:Oidioi.mRNA.OKI2018_I69.PAR.g10684.t1.cds [Oikopleura dioica]
MKLFALFGLALATDEVPHDPEALAFCHNACQGTPEALPGTGYCPDGFYPSFKDCDAYYLCWDEGIWADKFWCAPGAVYNPVSGECDWPFNLPEDSECYIPA